MHRSHYFPTLFIANLHTRCPTRRLKPSYIRHSTYILTLDSILHILTAKILAQIHQNSPISTIPLALATPLMLY